jgi:hypothetical protein
VKLIKVEKPFKHSEDGNIVNEYDVGEHEVSDRCADVAINQLDAAALVVDESKKIAASKKADK